MFVNSPATLSSAREEIRRDKKGSLVHNILIDVASPHSSLYSGHKFIWKDN